MPIWFAGFFNKLRSQSTLDRRAVLFTIYTLTSFIFACICFALSASSGSTFWVYATGAYGTLLVANYLYFYATHLVKISSWVLSVLTAFVVLFIYFFGGSVEYGGFLYLLYPIFIFSFLPRLESMVFCLLLPVLIFLVRLDMPQDAYSLTHDLNIFGVYTAISFAAFLHRFVASVNESSLTGQNLTYGRLMVEKNRDLKWSQALLDSSISSMPIGVYVFDEGHNLVFGNPVGMKLVGMENGVTASVIAKLSQITGLKISEICKSCSQSTRIDTLENAAYEGKILKFIIAPVIVFPEGKISGTIVLAEDVTRVREVEKSKDEFVSMISSELKVPLDAIEVNAGLLSGRYRGRVKNGTSRDLEFDDIIQKLESDSIKLNVLINDIVDLYHINEGKLALVMADVRVDSLVAREAARFKPLFDQKGLYMEVQKLGENFELISDRGVLAKVFDSLLDNALKFTEKGGLSIKIEDSGGGITIWFRDTGPGILPEYQKQIFERRKGGGLGLYKVKKQLNALGGDIGLAESTGQGSVFFITLPKK